MFHPAGTSQLSPRSSGYWLSRRVYFHPLQVPSTTAFPISSRLQMRQEFSADVQKKHRGNSGRYPGPDAAAVLEVPAAWGEPTMHNAGG